MDFVHRYMPGKLPVTVLLLHGSGGDENDLPPIGAGLAPGAALLSVRGNVVEHGVTRFFPFPASGTFDANAVIERVEELCDWLERVSAQYQIDPARLYALGYSNGANMAAAVMLLKPGSIAGACLLRSRAAIRPAALPKLEGTPVLLSAGQSDAIIPATDAELLAQTLSQAGARVDFVLQNAGHDLTPADFSVARQWFAKQLESAA